MSEQAEQKIAALAERIAPVHQAVIQAEVARRDANILRMLDQELYAQYLKAVGEDDNVQDVFKRLLFIASLGRCPEDSPQLFVGFEVALRERVVEDLNRKR